MFPKNLPGVQNLHLSLEFQQFLLFFLAIWVFNILILFLRHDLTVESPKENQIVMGNSVTVFGSTDSDAKITVNNQPVIVSDDGKFSVSLDVIQETKEIIIMASSRSGKTTTVIA